MPRPAFATTLDTPLPPGRSRQGVDKLGEVVARAGSVSPSPTPDEDEGPLCVDCAKEAYILGKDCEGRPAPRCTNHFVAYSHKHAHCVKCFSKGVRG